MDRSGWYLIAYDIAEPARLRRVNTQLRRAGLPVQQSVFFVQRTQREIHQLLNDLESLLHRREDDLRAYPIRHPGEVWFVGGTPVAGSLLLADSTPAALFNGCDKPRRNRLAWLFRRGK